MKKFMHFLNSPLMLWISGIFLLASFITEYILPLMGVGFEFVVNPAWVSLAISGVPLAYTAVVNTAKLKITSPLLITIAMIAAVYIGDVFAAGEVAFIMAIGEWLEDKTVEKAKKGIEKLLGLVPDVGRVIKRAQDGTELESLLPANEIKLKDVIRVLPGERFAADGVIVSGNTTVDQSVMTGESLPVNKEIGDEVFTGTINCFGSVDVQVEKAFSDSSLQKMIRLVEQAEEKKAPTQKTVDRWAGVLVPAACVIAVITYLVFAFLLNSPDTALIRAVTVLVVFCPCALALATPTSIMAAIGQATKQGVLIKSGEALEHMGGVTAVAFDKTGTITQGKLSFADIYSPDVPKEELLRKCYSAESHSEHPIAKAIVKYCKGQSVSRSDAQGFEMSPGKGISAQIEGEEVLCGNEKLIAERLKAEIPQDIAQKAAQMRDEGKAVVIVASGGRVLGLISLSDTIKQNAKQHIQQLKASGVSDVMLLTGDNQKAADYIASRVGIQQVHAQLLPQDKLNVVESYLQKGESICMIGDGVNDAPALKTASVGIAMGTMGSDIAIEAADIAITGDDISKVSYIKKLSNATLFSIKFNITLAMIINFGAIILSVAGLLNPATGALVHNAGSVLVVLNAARLYEKKIV